MTIFIIGGGVAGLAAYLSLRQTFPTCEIILLEKRPGEDGTIQSKPIGHGMILPLNAIQALETLGVAKTVTEQSNQIHRTSIRSANGRTLVEEDIQDSDKMYCCRRETIWSAIHDALTQLDDATNTRIRYGSKCVDVEIRDNNVVKLILADGTFYDVSRDDLVIGSDGYRSVLRRAFNQSKQEYTYSQVFELVTTTVVPELAQRLGSTFQKVVLPSKGIALGLVSPAKESVIGFIQFDTNRYQVHITKNDFKSLFQMFVSQLTKCPENKLFFEYNDAVNIDSCHVWRPVNEDLPQIANINNAVLIGDAWHPLLPFTSQGCATALQDAVSLTESLRVNSNNFMTIHIALKKFIEARGNEVETFISAGRTMLEIFLKNEEDNIELPYVKAAPYSRSLLSSNCLRQQEINHTFDDNVMFTDSEIDFNQLRKKAYNYRWATVPEDVIPLTAADFDFPLALPIREAMIGYINEGYTNYSPPKGLPSLREAIAKHRSTLSSHVFISNSAASAMFLIGQHCILPGDEVLCPDPVDFLFQRAIEHSVGRVVRYEIASPGRNGTSHWKFDPKEVTSLVTKRTKMIAICNPHNPIGRVWTIDELTELCIIARDNNLIIWSDEVWADISYKQFFSTAMVADELGVRSFTVVGFSKGYGLAGMRVGAILCPTSQDVEVISQLSLANDTAYGVAVLAQVAAQAALEKAGDWLSAFKKHLEAQCRFAVQRLNDIPHVLCTMPEGTFVCFANVSYYLDKGGMDEDALAEYLCKEAKVAVVPGSPRFFGMKASGYIRISVATSRGILEEALHRIALGLEKNLLDKDPCPSFPPIQSTELR